VSIEWLGHLCTGSEQGQGTAQSKDGLTIILLPANKADLLAAPKMTMRIRTNSTCSKPDTFQAPVLRREGNGLPIRGQSRDYLLLATTKRGGPWRKLNLSKVEQQYEYSISSLLPGGPVTSKVVPGAVGSREECKGIVVASYLRTEYYHARSSRV
jgi:hypothetical protein